MTTGAVTCSGCGAESAQSARFCASCGAPLGLPEPTTEVRKTVTAVFADVTGSTVLARRLDPEALRAVMEQYFAAVSAVLSRHGGTVEKFVGDAVMAVFGVPFAHEDDALRACRAAVEILSAVGEVDRRVEAAHEVRFGVRVGVETGEVVVGDASRGSTFASGVAVNTAARLEQAAEPGQCLVGPECFRLVRDRVVVEASSGLSLKGIDGVTDAHRLVSIREDDDGERPARVAMVGRSRELALLGQAFDRAAGDRTCQLATVLGPAGIGKSRLANEFLTSVDGQARVLRGRCVSYGEGVTYWPLVQAVRQITGLTGAEPEAEARAALAGLLDGVPDAAEVVDRVAPVAGLGGAPGPPEDTAWAVQQLLEALASDGPVVLVVDDLHWAEPGLVTVLEGICDWSRDAPILLAVFARAEFLDDHPSWGAGRTNAVAALLEPLADGDVDRLTSSLLGGLLPDDAADRVRDAAGGNPLFVEQLVAMLIEDGTLVRGDGDWVLAGDVTSLQIPPTITALLAARLDRLSASERSVLAAASVIGQVFYRGAVTELAAVPADQVPVQLKGLVRKGLVRPARSDLPGQEAFRFGHVLIRDAAYAALPKAARAELHERFARWLDKHEGQSYDDFVGSHLESAYQLRAELGALDEPGRQLGQQAAERLEKAGRLLLFADDKAAISRLERADALRTDEAPDRWAIQFELILAWWRSSVRLHHAGELAEQVRRAARDAGDERWDVLAALMAAQVRLHTQPEGGADALREASLTALEMFTAVDDHLGLSIVHQTLAEFAGTGARTGDQLRHMRLAAEHSELAGRHREAQMFYGWANALLIFDDTQAERALAESRSLFELAEDRSRRAYTALAVSFFATLLDERDEAARALDLAEGLAVGLHESVAKTITLVTSLAALHTGQWPVAARLLAEVCADNEEGGEIGVLSTNAAARAHALLHMAEPGLAHEQLELSQRIGGADDVLNQGLIPGALAWLAALDGDRTAWEHHIAVATVALPDEQLLNRALIHETCAEAAAVLGEHSVAHQHRQRALDLHQAKGNVVSVARLRAML